MMFLSFFLIQIHGYCVCLKENSPQGQRRVRECNLVCIRSSLEKVCHCGGGFEVSYILKSHPEGLLPLLSLTKMPSFARKDLDQQNYIEKAPCFPSITKGVDLCVYKPLHRPRCFVHKQGRNGALRNVALSLKRATCHHFQWAVGCETPGHPALMAGFPIPTCLSWLCSHFSR